MSITEEAIQFLQEVFPDRTYDSIRQIVEMVEEANPQEQYETKMDYIYNMLSDQRETIDVAPPIVPNPTVMTDNFQTQGTQPSTSGVRPVGIGDGSNSGFIYQDNSRGNFSGNDRVLNQTFNNLCNVFPDACPDYLWDFCIKRPKVDLDDAIDELTRDGYDKIILDATTIWDRLREALPNADPSYLEQEARKFAHSDPEELGATMEGFLTNAIEKNDYPTMEQYIKNQEEEDNCKIYYKTHFNPVHYLEIIPNPEVTFRDPNRKPPLADPNIPEEDIQHAKVFLYNAYPYIRKRHIDLVFNRKRDRLIECVDELDYIKKGMKVARRAEKEPMSKNMPLLQEIAYLRHRGLLKRFVKQKDETYRQIKEEARKLNLLETCSICYEEELIPEECYLCTEGCIFCKDCVKKGAETRIGDGHVTFPCFNSCDGAFADRTLQLVLPKKSFDRLIQRIQSEEIKKANLDGLETCPFCYYACVPPENSIIFECKNVDCMKQSCRKCRHESHIPARCNEIEYDEDVQRRTFIENRMTDALTRKCHSCGKTFIKTTGCNKMTCFCGAKMCYLCSQPIDNYSHFNGAGPCRLFTNDDQINLDRIRQQAERAKRDLGDVEIKFDPTVGIENYFRAQ